MDRPSWPCRIQHGYLMPSLRRMSAYVHIRRAQKFARRIESDRDRPWSDRQYNDCRNAACYTRWNRFTRVVENGPTAWLSEEAA